MPDIPVKFRTATPPFETSVEFADLVTGQGKITFYLTASYPAHSYHLITKTDPSSRLEYSRTSSGTIIFDFDTQEFKETKTVDGDAQFIIAVMQDNSSSQMWVSGALILVDSDSNETAVSSVIESVTGVGTNSSKMVNLIAPLTKTTFHAGEKMRFRLGVTKSSNNGTGAVGMDPAARYGTWITSSLANDPITTNSRIVVPFKLS